RAMPEFNDVASDQQTQGYQIDITVDRDKASRLNVLPVDIDNTLYDAFGQRIVSTIFTQLNQYRVILEVEPSFQRDPAALSKIYIKSSTGQLVPLGAIATMTPTPTPLVITHEGQLPAATISFNLRRGYFLSDAVDALGRAEQQIGLPETI